jgi:hypothetical protein
MVFLGDPHYRPFASKWGSSCVPAQRNFRGAQHAVAARHGAIQFWSHLNGRW